MKKYFHTTVRLWRLLKPFHNDFYTQLLLIIVAQILSIVLVIMLSKSINFIVDKDYILAVYFIIFYFFITLFRSLVSYYKEKLSIQNLTLSISQYLQEYSFKNVFKLNASQYVEDHSAIKLQVINRGEEAVQSIISTFILNLLPTVTQVVFSVAAIAWYSLPVALITIFTLIIVTVWTNKFTNFHRPYVKKNIDLWDVQRKVRTEAFQHLSLIKVTGVEDSYLKNYLNKRSEIIEHSILTRQLTNSHNTKRWTLFSFSNAISRICLVYYAYLGQITIGHIYAVWTWIADANGNIFNVIQAMRTIPLNFIELEKYLDIIDKEPDFNEARNMNFVNGDIEIKNLSFKYPKGESHIFKDLNLTIKQGQKTAFVGFSGSGKSTITKLLLRIYDFEQGDITFGGFSIKDLDIQKLRKEIGYVEQHVELFDTSIKENILFSVPGMKNYKDKLERVVKLARIDQFFHRLGSEGLNTIIGEKGVKLSGGERQRIGIARTLIKDPSVLIFDEATASLDNENEHYIQEAIDESSKGRTTIIIAHRLSTVQNADKIIVMDRGSIVGSGTHEELKNNNETYKRLLNSQH